MKKSETENSQAVGWMMAGPFVFAALGLLGLALLWSYAYAFVVLWEWFAVPLNLPAIAVPTVMGAFLLKNIAFYRQKRQDEKFDWSTFAGRLLYPWLAIGMGWVITWWFAG